MMVVVVVVVVVEVVGDACGSVDGRRSVGG